MNKDTPNKSDFKTVAWGYINIIRKATQNNLLFKEEL